MEDAMAENTFNDNTYQQSEELATGFVLRQLKTIAIEGFGFTNEFEVHIVRYLLENASILEKMKIRLLSSVQENVKMWWLAREMLLAFSKGSPNADIEFS
ncbi:hypothetical protein IFM89_038288 [Coptis chinensis]|uniref:FBD domain-containing protein n=1 Tax=Coptis chinensis TaxID=261450 RepID=A0A835H038_9MAGN|nr:hypothetical protein IFM89_038288 [Coptis chinensis]